MKPTLPDGLNFVNASYKSSYGLIKSGWKKNGKELEWNITIPANSSAKIFIPALSANDVAEGGAPLSLSKDIKLLEWKDGVLTVEVPSGDYQFKSIIK
jgi:alpha-L-rhamnosidase